MDWIINKYFFGNKDIFGKNPTLIRLSDIPILNYVKVKKGVRVYCKDDKEYWQKRDERLTNQRLIKYRKSLYKKQEGKCTYCDYPILPSDKLQVHHIIPKAEGGTNSHSNLMLTHAECHRELHNI